MTNNQLIAMMAAQIFAANDGMKQYQALDAARDLAAACGITPEPATAGVPVDVVERLVEACRWLGYSPSGLTRMGRVCRVIAEAEAAIDAAREVRG